MNSMLTSEATKSSAGLSRVENCRRRGDESEREGALTSCATRRLEPDGEANSVYELSNFDMMGLFCVFLVGFSRIY